jgi:hypothetical protein
VEVRDLSGMTVTGVEASDRPGLWVFRFGKHWSAAIESAWRIMKDGGVALGVRDHGQRSGAHAPLDAAAEAQALLRGRKVVSAGLAAGSCDLRVEFEGDVVLEAFVDSSGSGSCNILGPGGVHWIVGGRR